MLGQPAHDVDALRPLHVETDVALPAVLLREVRRDRVDAGIGEPRQIAVGRLDLDHVGAEVAEHASAVGTGQDPGQIEDANAVERTGAGDRRTRHGRDRTRGPSADAASSPTLRDMADEDNGLHDPWAPPRSEPVDSIPPPEPPPPAQPDVPTRAVPLGPGMEAGLGPAGLVEPEPEPVVAGGLSPEAIAVAPAAAAAATATAQIPVAAEPRRPPPAPKRGWPSAAKATAIVLAVALVAACAGLGYGWWKTNQDKKDLETASNQQGQELSQQLTRPTPT